MIDSHSLAEYSSQVLNATNDAELDQRLGLYRVFLKLYEHHRGLLDEILELENIADRGRGRSVVRFIQGVIQGPQTYLVTNLVKGKTRSMHQSQNVWLLGRDRKAALSIQDKRLSRRHAAIQYVDKEGFHLVDLNSTNGSFVNGEPVRQSVLLKDGDQVRLGSLTFTFFMCYTARTTEVIPDDLLSQISAIRQPVSASPDKTTVSEPVHSGTTEWDTSLPVNSDETSMFHLTPGHSDRVSNMASAPFSTAQQGEILDRFLKR